MKLTSGGELALKAMIELARVESLEGAALSAPQLAQRCHATVSFLEQVLVELRKGGFVVSSRGRSGGHRLAHPAAEIYLGQINRHMDGPLAPAPCASLTRHRACDWCLDEATCELKPVWTRVRDAIADVMDSISLADVIAANQPVASRYSI
jgi:Rrf2 family protein